MSREVHQFTFQDSRRLFAFYCSAQHPICAASFTDPEGISHAVDVTGTTLYEAAVFAVAAVRRARLVEAHVGP